MNYYLHTYLRPKEMFRFDCNWSNTRSKRIFCYFDFLIHVIFCLWCWNQSLYFFMPMAGSKIWNSIFSESTFGLWCTLNFFEKSQAQLYFHGTIYIFNPGNFQWAMTKMSFYTSSSWILTFSTVRCHSNWKTLTLQFFFGVLLTTSLVQTAFKISLEPHLIKT